MMCRRGVRVCGGERAAQRSGERVRRSHGVAGPGLAGGGLAEGGGLARGRPVPAGCDAADRRRDGALGLGRRSAAPGSGAAGTDGAPNNITCLL